MLEEIGTDTRFTAEEHSYVTEKEFGNIFKSKEALLDAYFREDYSKLSALGFLIKHIYEEGYKNILSLGSGTCVLEYLLKCALPEKSEVIATDFDSFMIRNAKRLFPSIKALVLDFCKDDLSKIKEMRIDLAVFFGSSYVMDDTEFISLLSKLKDLKVKEIIDFHAGYIQMKEIPKLIFMKIGGDIMEKFGLLKFRGKFHGYRRTRGELRRLYQKAGLKIVRELAIQPYRYIAICKC